MNSAYVCEETANEPCENERCQDCCEHEYDPGEGMMCINCGKEYPY